MLCVHAGAAPEAHLVGGEPLAAFLRGLPDHDRTVAIAHHLQLCVRVPLAQLALVLPQRGGALLRWRPGDRAGQIPRSRVAMPRHHRHVPAVRRRIRSRCPRPRLGAR